MLLYPLNIAQLTLYFNFHQQMDSLKEGMFIIKIYTRKNIIIFLKYVIIIYWCLTVVIQSFELLKSLF